MSVQTKEKIELTKNYRSLLALMTLSDLVRSLRHPAKSTVLNLGIGKRALKILIITHATR